MKLCRGSVCDFLNSRVVERLVRPWDVVSRYAPHIVRGTAHDKEHV